MSQNLDILFGVTGQSLVFDAPEGKPSSVTSSTVYENTSGDDGTAEGATTGSAAVESSPATTFDAASGDGQANPQKCNLTATTGCVVGRRYLATNAAGERDWVEVTQIASADYVIARHPLANAYTTSDAFVSTRIAHAVDSTWVADSTNLSHGLDPNARYRWRLVYVVASVTYVHDVYFDLLRYAGRYSVSGHDVEARFAGWLRAVGTFEREDQGSSVIAEAYRHIKFDLYNLGLPDQAIRNREVVNELVKLCAGAMVFNTEEHWRLYNSRIAQLVAMGKASTSKSSSAAASPGEIQSKWSK